jgi:hypothetical protein
VRSEAARLLDVYVQAELSAIDARPRADAQDRLRELLLLAEQSPGAAWDVRAAQARSFARDWPAVMELAERGRTDDALERAEWLAGAFPSDSPQARQLAKLKQALSQRLQETAAGQSRRGLHGAAVVSLRLAERAGASTSAQIASATEQLGLSVRATGARGPCGQLADRVVALLPLRSAGSSGLDLEIDVKTCEPKPEEKRRMVDTDNGPAELTTATATVTLSGEARVRSATGEALGARPFSATRSKTEEGLGAPPNAAEMLIEDAADLAVRAAADELRSVIQGSIRAQGEGNARQADQLRSARDFDQADHLFVSAMVLGAGATSAARAHFSDRYGWSDPEQRLRSTPGPTSLRPVSLSLGPQPVPLPMSEEAYDDFAPSPPHFALRAGFGGETGQLGFGLEVRPWDKKFGLIVGTGAYLLTAGFSFSFAETFAQSGPYVDLHGTLVKPGLFSTAVGDGLGAGATVGYDFRPEPWLSLKAGIGGGYNKAAQPSDKTRPLIFDFNVGVVF